MAILVVAVRAADVRVVAQVVALLAADDRARAVKATTVGATVVVTDLQTARLTVSANSL